MNTQSEQQLEHALIAQLETLGWDRVTIKDETDLVANLKAQLETHNKISLSEAEFGQILNKLSQGNIFQRAKVLRDKLDYQRDDSTTGYIELINQVHWCKNQYQVANQITMEGKYKNRYDVTLLVNGLPLVQIELKRRGLDMKEAFNQFGRYDKHSFSAGHGLFNFLQLCIMSNGVNTKYFANTPIKKRDFKQTFFWTDRDNRKISNLSEFAEVFLEKCALSKMITKYIVLNESHQALMALRPYQVYAVEGIVDRVQNTAKNGYIWHTTGSGKTLTSFKAAHILQQMKDVHKVVFVVDRKDLDFQTIREFNSFQDSAVDSTANTSKLVQKFGDDTPLIVTTLQKLNTAISRQRHLSTMGDLKDKKMVFIFDECHRSQFGDTHRRIVDFFPNVQMFGFTGTPIFRENAAKNALGKRTTKDLFDECLHKYVITDAIRDENVLKFCVEYISTFKGKDGTKDIEVEAIDTAEVMEAPERLENIVDYVIANHNRKTHSREFTAIMAVSNVETLKRYYALFKAKREAGEHKLKIGTIFSYAANQEDQEADGMGGGDLIEDGATIDTNNRDALEAYIGDYNAEFGTNWTTKDTRSFYGYYQDVGKKVGKKQIDILLVVNMFLTGFDSKTLNTIYVDKNLKHHGLIQAYSRTNRILGAKKSQGNVVCFRNLKPATDKALELFANKAPHEEVFLAPYEDYLKQFEEALAHLHAIAPTVESVDNLSTEEEEALFIKAFRDVIRLKNVLDCFSQFTFDGQAMDAQTFADYRSKYLDLYEKVKSENQKEKVSILDDLDFEIELITRDRINVSYIVRLLADMRDQPAEAQAKVRRSILDTMDSDPQLRSKKELIEKFLAEHFANLTADSDVEQEFDTYWQEQRRQAAEALAEEEGLHPEGLETLLQDYLFTSKTPIRDDIIGALKERPRLKERKSIADRVLGRIQNYIQTFIEGVD